MSTVKNQHYVPQFYLQRFCDEKSKLFVFDKTNLNVFHTKPGNVAAERYFYDQHEIDTRLGKQYIEHNLGQIETAFSLLLQDLLEGMDNRKTLHIKDELKLRMSNFVALQAIRTKEQRQSMEQFFSTMKLGFTEKGWLNAEQVDEMGFNISAEQARLMHNSQLLPDNSMLTELSSILMSHICLIFKNTTDMPLLTSDHPVAKKSNINDGVRSNFGYRSPGIEVMFPLSPQYMLTFLERTHFKSLERYENEVLLLHDIQNVIHYNSYQVMGSYRYLFSKNGNFELAREMIAANPHLGQVDRMRHGTA